MNSVPLPMDFVKRIQMQLSEGFRPFLESLEKPNSSSIRLHPKKRFDVPFDSDSVAWCENGRTLYKRPKFTEQPELFAGAYYVQESSSMFLWHILKTQLQGQRAPLVLDLCASPGGKSTLISDFLDGKGFLISNEVTAKRLPALVENFVRWGTENQIITQNKASDFARFKGCFDLIAVDAPCSGEGMFRKDHEARQLWSSQFVGYCAKTQREIVSQVIPALKTDGLLVYSTCTFSEAENEENVQWYVENFDLESIRIDVPISWGVVETHFRDTWGYRFYPHKVAGEGFFVTCLRKRKNEKHFVPKPTNLQWRALGKKDHFVENIDKQTLYHFGDQIVKLPSVSMKFNGHFNVKKAGLEIGSFKGQDFVPSHNFAMSPDLPINFKRFQLDKFQALDFLRKKEIRFETHGFTGWAIAEYLGLALGWVKVLENRINNRYPFESRLLKNA